VVGCHDSRLKDRGLREKSVNSSYVPDHQVEIHRGPAALRVGPGDWRKDGACGLTHRVKGLQESRVDGAGVRSPAHSLSRCRLGVSQRPDFRSGSGLALRNSA
jgi:hypothetical protein